METPLNTTEQMFNNRVKRLGCLGGDFFCVCVIYFFRLESIFASVNDTRLHMLTFFSILQNAFQSQRSLWSLPGRDCPDGHHRTLFHG